MLEFEQDDAEALSALGLQWHQGRLLTRPQIEQEKKVAGERLRATKRWQPQIVKWRNAILHGNAEERASALENLRGLTDPAAVAALDATFVVHGDSKQAIDLNQVLFETLGRISGQEATQALLRHALNADTDTNGT